MSDTALITYLPHDGDNDTAYVLGHRFVAEQPSEVDLRTAAGVTILGRVQNNPWFHVGPNPPKSQKAEAISTRALEHAATLEQMVTDFKHGHVTHAHGQMLMDIADAINRSTR